jgi:IclR family transcriptional regulator, pca regulon regulatory protein
VGGAVPKFLADTDPYILSLERGLAVIRAFSQGRERLIIAEVAKICGLTRAGARRILLTLQRLGYVDNDGRQFFLTPQVLELGAGFLQRTIWDKAENVLRDLVDELNETASTGVLTGFDVVYTKRVRCARAVHIDMREGAHVTAHVSSIGRVLLAGLPDRELDRYLGQAEFVRYTQHTVTDAVTLRSRLEQVRSDGWAVVQGEMDEAMTGVAVPLRDASGRTFAGVSVGILAPRATPQFIDSRVLPLLQDASKRIAKLA